MRYFFIPLFFAGALFAQEPYTPPSQEVIQSELRSAEENFEIARKMFQPWYSGPLLTGSAVNAAPGQAVVQPYIFTTVTHAEYDDDRHSKNIPNFLEINPLYYFQTGITDWLDTYMTVPAIFNRQSDIWGSYSGDSSIAFGIQLQKETPYRPYVRLTISETLPTGKYDNLDPEKNGVDATGGGSYNTTFSFNLSKVFWWSKLHPIAMRSNLFYTFTTPTHVDNLNAYGGGPGTDGKVKPGNSWGIDVGYEYSITQRWVFALDAVYTYFNKASFSGSRGRDANGNPFSVGGPSGDQLSFAPAIEYNPSSTFGMVAGVWFTATGRNSGNFASLVYTFYAVF
ncbi:MAG: hypothetical protein SNF33_06270 [Candidatus Algichlamydia australiensis]|nr:hypothetical protein [Chlamydiales bacterium]